MIYSEKFSVMMTLQIKLTQRRSTQSCQSEVSLPLLRRHSHLYFDNYIIHENKNASKSSKGRKRYLNFSIEYKNICEHFLWRRKRRGFKAKGTKGWWRQKGWRQGQRGRKEGKVIKIITLSLYCSFISFEYLLYITSFVHIEEISVKFIIYNELNIHSTDWQNLFVQIKFQQ